MNEQPDVRIGHRFVDESAVMQHALAIARQGIGRVEPNPAVGAVIVDDHLTLIADGFHRQFGEAHAEVAAIAAANEQTAGQQLFVTLEPCSHHGKTPPCADAVIAAGFRRVVIGCTDPAPHVAGAGIQRLKDAGVEVTTGVCEEQARQLIAPFRKLQQDCRPWVHAKWAMTLDGRIATRTGHSQWISNEKSRAEVHRLRGRMDAIITGAGTVRADDPQLTARPGGPRVPLRVVVDSTGKSLQPSGKLVQTTDEAPVLLCVRQQTMDVEHCENLKQQDIEVCITSGDTKDQVAQLLDELGKRQMTNVLLEAGPGLMGSFFDADLVDEVHVYVAPKIVGSNEAMSPVGGHGRAKIPDCDQLDNLLVRSFDSNMLIEGRISDRTICNDPSSQARS